MSFRKRTKITFIDIDSAGVVFYSRLLHNFHIAMEEFFDAELGIDYDDVIHERNLSLPTVHIEADFIKRMRYKDEIDVEVSILDIGTASITWGYRGYRVGDDELVVRRQQRDRLRAHRHVREDPRARLVPQGARRLHRQGVAAPAAATPRRAAIRGGGPRHA